MAWLGSECGGPVLSLLTLSRFHVSRRLQVASTVLRLKQSDGSAPVKSMFQPSVLCLLGAVVNWRAPSGSLAWVDSAWASAFGSISSDIASASFDEWRDVIGQGHVTGDGRRRARVSRRFEGARPNHAQNNERNSPDHDISQLHVGLAFYRTGSIVDLLRVYTVTLRGGFVSIAIIRIDQIDSGRDGFMNRSKYP